MSPQFVGYDAQERKAEELASLIKSFKARVTALVNSSPHKPKRQLSFKRALMTLSDRALEFNVTPKETDIAQVRSMRGHEKFFSKEPLGNLIPSM
jgi:hypothetical protein